MNGVFGILFRDLSLENDIKTIWKKTKIKAGLTLNLINLTSKGQRTDIYKSCMKMWEEYCPSANKISALVALLNKDLSNIRIFADLLNADYKLASIVFALASKNVDILSESYSEISKRLEVNSETAVRVMVEVFWGKFDTFYEFASKSQLFETIDKDMIVDLLNIIKLSIKSRDGSSQSEIPNSQSHLKRLWSKLFDVIEYKSSEESKNIDKDPLFINISNLVNAVWGNTEALDYLQLKIAEYNDKNKGFQNRINRIWTEYQSESKKILQSCFENVFSSHK